jgi:hypothetical protein
MTEDIVTRLREWTDYKDGGWPGRDEYMLVTEAADEIERLRTALGLACGLLSTYYAMSPPDKLMQQFLEEARHG